MSSDDSLRRAEELLERLEAVRARLEGMHDPDEAIAKETQAELERAREEST